MSDHVDSTGSKVMAVFPLSSIAAIGDPTGRSESKIICQSGPIAWASSIGIGIWFLRLLRFALIFVKFLPSDIPCNLYHREILWSNTKKSGEEIYSQRILWTKLKLMLEGLSSQQMFTINSES